jgi:hypothetical protein
VRKIGDVGDVSTVFVAEKNVHVVVFHSSPPKDRICCPPAGIASIIAAHADAFATVTPVSDRRPAMGTPPLQYADLKAGATVFCCARGGVSAAAAHAT